MDSDEERRENPGLRVLLTGAAREGAAIALKEFCEKVLQIDPDESADVRAWQADLRWAHRMRKTSEKGRMIFFGVAVSVASYFILTSIWDGFGRAVKAVLPAVPIVVALILALALLGCAAPSPQPLRLVPYGGPAPYDGQRDEYNRKLALEAFCMKHGLEPDYAGGTCKAR